MTIDADKLRALLEKATPRPWRWSDWSAPFGSTERRGLMSTLTGNDPRPPDPQPAERGRYAGSRVLSLEDPIENAADYHLIAAAVNALPELLAVYEAACAYADSDEADYDSMFPCERALLTAIDAARGKR